LSFEVEIDERTRCIVRRMFLIVIHERCWFRFFQIHSFTESIVMCSIGTSFQSASRRLLHVLLMDEQDVKACSYGLQLRPEL